MVSDERLKLIIFGSSKAERPENVRAHIYKQTPNKQPRGFGWRIHCGVEVTESSTIKQHTLSIKSGAMSSRARHPSMSAADTGERVQKYLAMCLILKCC
jgi:hypothetical protein